MLESDIDPRLLARLARRDGGAGGVVAFAALDATAPALRARCADWALDKGTMDALSCAKGATLGGLSSRAWRMLLF